MDSPDLPFHLGQMVNLSPEALATFEFHPSRLDGATAACGCE
jgi:hypothetical protein